MQINFSPVSTQQQTRFSGRINIAGHRVGLVPLALAAYFIWTSPSPYLAPSKPAARSTNKASLKANATPTKAPAKSKTGLPTAANRK